MATIKALLNKTTLVLAMLATARREYGSPFFKTLARFIKLHSMRFSPKEMAHLDLLDTRRGQDYLESFISNEALLDIQRRLNPLALSDETEDKLVFHRRCRELGLPVPACVAELHPADLLAIDGAEVRHQGPQFIGDLCRNVPPGRYVLKPANGTSGSGIAMVEQGAHLESSPFADIIEAHMRSHPDYDAWMLQERLENHAVLQRLSPSRALQTFRIIAHVDNSGDIRLLAARIRLAPGDAIVDNVSNVDSPGILCGIDAETGLIENCWRRRRYPLEFGMERFQENPVTGKPLVGLQPPQWNEVVELAKRAARAFADSRTLGWDIAATDRGPFIIEANRYWDPPNPDGKMGEISAYLRSELDSNTS